MNENLKKVAEPFLQIINAADKSTQDGLQLADLGNFMAPLMNLPGAFESINAAGAEAKALDQAGLVDFHQFIKDNLDLVNDDIEKFAENVLGIVVSIYGAIQEFKGL